MCIFCFTNLSKLKLCGVVIFFLGITHQIHVLVFANPAYLLLCLRLKISKTLNDLTCGSNHSLAILNVPYHSEDMQVH